jgi:hypothetical protein
VEHCGGKHAVNFVHSLTLTDIHSGWTECAALVLREQTLVVEGLSLIRGQLPFALRGLDTDNELSEKSMARDEHTSAVARRASKAGYDCAIVEKTMRPGSLRGGAPSRVRSHSSPADAALDRRRHCG